jgi:hypothetical protein
LGIDIHALKFLQYVSGKKKFGQTITLGRQTLHVSSERIGREINTVNDYSKNKFCEELLINEFGALKVDSLDNSAYEDANIICNLNLPLELNLQSKYDTVIDAGTSEHIYQISQALKSISEIVKPGGTIIHILPANNLCGHGFWQFSPELFFSLYSEDNGYSELEIFIADIDDSKNWYKVLKPENGNRVEVRGAIPQYILVKVIRGQSFSHHSVFQSDYVEKWNNFDHTELDRKKIKRNIYMNLYKLNGLYAIAWNIAQPIKRMMGVKKYGFDYMRSNVSFLKKKIKDILDS